MAKAKVPSGPPLSGPLASAVSEAAFMIEHAPRRKYLADPERAIKEGAVVVVVISNKKETVRLVGTVRNLKQSFDLVLKSGDKIACKVPAKLGTTVTVAPAVFEYRKT